MEARNLELLGTVMNVLDLGGFMQRHAKGSVVSVFLTVVVLLGSVFESTVPGQQVTSESLLSEAKQTVDPREKQRKLRQEIQLDSMNVEARVLLGASYFETGNIVAAEHQFNATISIADSADNSFSDAHYYLGEIDRFFKPLRISISDRRVSALGYIEGVEIQFRSPPRSLTTRQQSRLDHLQNRQGRQFNEFQVKGIDRNGVPFFRIPFFPVVVSLDDPSYSKYSLIMDQRQKSSSKVEGRRRYRFDFNETKQDSVPIHWHDEWNLVERVPFDLVKIRYPATYTFTPVGDSRAFTLEDSVNDQKSLYVRADKNVEVVLSDSRESDRERMLGRVIKGIVAVAALIGLGGAR